VTTQIKSRSEGAKRPQARTRLARRAIVEAARALFLERGYPATTIEAISDRSDVPPATIYRLLSSKIGILKALVDVSIVGDDEELPLQDRSHARALFAETDPTRQLAGFARVCREINARTAPFHRILASAADADPEAASLLTDYVRQRQEGQALIARSLARAGALRPKMRERDAADIIHVLMSPEVYRLLVADRAWPPERYEQWLSGILVDQLLSGARTPRRVGQKHGSGGQP
jgi:AcrR family transcriptional regulator